MLGTHRFTLGYLDICLHTPGVHSVHFLLLLYSFFVFLAVSLLLSVICLCYWLSGFVLIYPIVTVESLLLLLFIF